jgi:N-methylhydantoinase B
VLESQHPIRVEDYSLVSDSGGAGRWRGGLGVARSYRLLAADATLQLRADRVRFRPYGLDGGTPGGASCNMIMGAAGWQPLAGKVTRAIVCGDLIRHEQAGGGGFGNPYLREPERVLEDVRDDKVSLDMAREQYGVVIRHLRDAGTLELDRAATDRLRAEREPA